MAEIDEGWKTIDFEVRWTNRGTLHTRSFGTDRDGAKALVGELPYESCATLVRTQAIETRVLLGTQTDMFALVSGREPGKTAHNEVIATWTKMFDAERGCRPTWGAKQGTLVKRIIKQHGLTEVLRRINICFTDPPDWPFRPDFPAFAQHFDLFSGAKKKNNSNPSRMSVSKIVGKK